MVVRATAMAGVLAAATGVAGAARSRLVVRATAVLAELAAASCEKNKIALKKIEIPV